MIQINAEDKTKYIAQLPLEVREQILYAVEEHLAVTDEEYYLVEEAMNGRICDLEDTIEIEYK